MFCSDVQVNSRVLQVHIQCSMQKLFPLKDLHNLKAKNQDPETTDREATLNHLYDLHAKDPGAAIEILVRDVDMTLELQIIQTSAIKRASRNF